MKSSINLEAKVSDTGQAQLVVSAVADNDENLQEYLQILHRPDAIGVENSAYFVFGIPGTPSYTFMDLNKLPDDVTVCIQIQRDGSPSVCSQFKGKSGNVAVPE